MELGKSGRYFPVKIPSQDEFLTWMYGHAVGRMLLWPMTRSAFSRLGGFLLDSSLSAWAVEPFRKKNKIDLTECEKKSFCSFNDFFTRKLKPEARPVCMDPEILISPCDARLSVYEIKENQRFLIKQTRYSLRELLKNRRLAKRYAGGTLWLFRLCVDDYHRYLYPVTGYKSENVKIPGVFHTVNPVANDVYPIYKENTREYCLIQTKEFGTVLMMEVGAMLVGRIENRESVPAKVKRGEEKGNFAFGGSTIIMLTQKDEAKPDPYLLLNTAEGIETRVKAGEPVGCTCKQERQETEE